VLLTFIAALVISTAYLDRVSDGWFVVLFLLTWGASLFVKFRIDAHFDRRNQMNSRAVLDRPVISSVPSNPV